MFIHRFLMQTLLCLLSLGAVTSCSSVAADKTPILNTAAQAQQLQYLLDRQQIEDVVKAYAVSIDNQDWDLHRSIFTPTYQLYRKGGYKTENIEERIKRLTRFTSNYQWTQHFASIYKVDVEGDEAFVISSLQARHKRKTNEQGESRGNDYMMVGQYHYWLSRTDDGWKINKMRLIRFRGWQG